MRRKKRKQKRKNRKRAQSRNGNNGSASGRSFFFCLFLISATASKCVQDKKIWKKNKKKKNDTPKKKRKKKLRGRGGADGKKFAQKKKEKFLLAVSSPGTEVGGRSFLFFHLFFGVFFLSLLFFSLPSVTTWPFYLVEGGGPIFFLAFGGNVSICRCVGIFRRVQKENAGDGEQPWRTRGRRRRRRRRRIGRRSCCPGVPKDEPQSRGFCSFACPGRLRFVVVSARPIGGRVMGAANERPHVMPVLCTCMQMTALFD